MARPRARREYVGSWPLSTGADGQGDSGSDLREFGRGDARGCGPNPSQRHVGDVVGQRPARLVHPIVEGRVDPHRERGVSKTDVVGEGYDQGGEVVVGEEYVVFDGYCGPCPRTRPRGAYPALMVLFGIVLVWR